MPKNLPVVVSLRTISQRLPDIFPEGIAHRTYCIREMAARTIWVMLYAGAIEGSDRWIRPSMVTDMTNRQAALRSETARNDWVTSACSSRKKRPARAWYAPNSREPIRDETIRLGLIPCGAVIERKGIPTTSSLPKYALANDFAMLFDQDLTGPSLRDTITAWQEAHLNRAALARVALIKKGLSKSSSAVLVTYPNGHTRSLAPGPSSVISKSVIEEFAKRYLEEPAVLWLSESSSKVREVDDELARTLGFRIDPAKELPDIILVDLGKSGEEVLIVFVEVVATDGPIEENRKAALLRIANEAGFDDRHIAFVTAFTHRAAAEFKKAIPDLALGTYAWFVAEPDSLLIMRNGKPVPLKKLR